MDHRVSRTFPMCEVPEFEVNGALWFDSCPARGPMLVAPALFFFAVATGAKPWPTTG